MVATSLGGGTNTDNQATVAMTVAAAVSSGTPILVGAASGRSARTHTSTTDSGSNTYTEREDNTEGDATSVIADALSPSTGLTSGVSTITATFSGNTSRSGVGAVKLSGAASLVASSDASAGGSGTTASVTTGAVIPVGGVVIAVVIGEENSDSDLSVPSGWTAAINTRISGQIQFMVAFKTTTAGTTESFSVTIEDGDWTASIAGYAGAGSTIPQKMRHYMRMAA